MSALEDEIQALTAKWYAYVNLDHHKDKDCHFYIEKRWSYGKRAQYRAWHYGYRAKDWAGPWRYDPAAAHLDLRNFLDGIVSSALDRVREAIAARVWEDPDNWEDEAYYVAELAALE